MRGEEGKNSPLPSAPLSKTRLFCRGRKKFGAEKNKLLCFHKTTRALRHGVRRLFRFLSVGALGSCIRSGEQEGPRRRNGGEKLSLLRSTKKKRRRERSDGSTTMQSRKQKAFDFLPLSRHRSSAQPSRSPFSDALKPHSLLVPPLPQKKNKKIITFQDQGREADPGRRQHQDPQAQHRRRPRPGGLCRCCRRHLRGKEDGMRGIDGRAMASFEGKNRKKKSFHFFFARSLCFALAVSLFSSTHCLKKNN